MTAIALMLKNRLAIGCEISKYHATHDSFFSTIYYKARGCQSSLFSTESAFFKKNEAVSFPELGSEVPVFLAL